MNETEAKDYQRGLEAQKESEESRQAESPDIPKMPDIHELEGYEGLYWMGSAEVYAYRDEMVAWADERVAAAVKGGGHA